MTKHTKSSTPKPDLYRRADRDQTLAYIYLMRGDSSKSLELAQKAEQQMAQSVADTGATGQLSQVRNTLTDILIANAALNSVASINASENNFEQMYADAAKRELDTFSDSRGARLARAINSYLKPNI